MNILVDKFPTKVRIEGHTYELNTDFRNCLKIMFAFQDDELTVNEQVSVMLNLLYKTVPGNLEKAYLYAMRFLNCETGQDTEKRASERFTETCLYSWEKDAKYIYSAIKQAHGVDLETVEHLHWWKFVYMFLDLNKDCQFYFILNMREKKRKGKLTKEEREWCNKHKDIIALPVKLTAEEKEKIAKAERYMGKHKA